MLISKKKFDKAIAQAKQEGYAAGEREAESLRFALKRKQIEIDASIAALNKERNEFEERKAQYVLNAMRQVLSGDKEIVLPDFWPNGRYR